MSKRLERLEQDSRDRATAELRLAWASLTDEEVAELLAPYADWSPTSHPNPQEREIEKRLRALMPEELIAQAAGLKDGMEDEEVGRRIRSLFGESGLPERRDNIRRHLLASSEGGAR